MKINAIICDIDGTVALKGNRAPYDFSKVYEDTVNEPVATVVFALGERWPVLYVSGREDSCREETFQWLEDNNLWWRNSKLFMRRSGDYRKDSVVKKEIYEGHIEPFYNIIVTLDDRNQVVDMWRDLGLTCLQVAPGDF